MSLMILLKHGLLFCLIALAPLSFFQPSVVAFLFSVISGLSLWALLSLYDAEGFFFLLYIFLLIKLVKHPKLLFSIKNIKFCFSFFWTFTALTLIGLINLGLKWEWGPSGSNQDTLWNAGHIAYFKSRNILSDGFKDIHILGYSFDYHLFGQYILATFSKSLGSSAIATAVTSNSLFLLAGFFISFLFLRRFSNNSALSALLAFLGIVVSGLLSPFFPYIDPFLNTLGAHNFQIALLVTFAFLLLAIGTYSYLYFFLVPNLSNYFRFMLSFNVVFCTILLCLTKGPYSAIFACAVLAHSGILYLIGKANLKLVGLGLVNMLGFVSTLLLFFSGIGSDVVSIDFGALVKRSPLNEFVSGSWPGLFAASIVYCFSFAAPSLVGNSWILFKNRGKGILFQISTFGLISCLGGLVAMMIFSQEGNSQLYFGFAGLVISNLALCTCIAIKVIQSGELSGKAIRVATAISAVFFVSMTLNSSLKMPNAQELTVRRACLWVQQNSNSHDIVAINQQDDLRGGKSRFFACSALSERQILLEGSDYSSDSQPVREMILELQRRNDKLFQEPDSASALGVRYLIDTRGEVSGLIPAFTAQATPTSTQIRVFKLF